VGGFGQHACWFHFSSNTFDHRVLTRFTEVAIDPQVLATLEDVFRRAGSR
jgi:hypothetical protein